MPKSGQMTITKIENLHRAHVEKFIDSKNAILFDLRRKITKLSRKKNRFRTVASLGACGLGRLELTFRQGRV